MKKILHIISSPRAEASISIKLGNAIIEKIQYAYPQSSIKEVNLVKNPFPHLDEHHIASFFTPSESRTAENIQAIHQSDQAISAIQDADFIVIGAPLYNFGIHSSLKAWLDHIARAGETFRYTEDGPEGLIKGKKVFIAMASGGIYSDGPMKSFDFVVPYLKTVLNFLGMSDVTVIRAEGISMPGVQETALDKAINSISIAESIPA